MPFEVALLGVIAAMLAVNATMIGVLLRNNGRKNRPHHPTNPLNPEDLSQFRLGDMSAAWYDARHNDLLTALEDIKKAIRPRGRR